MPDPKQLKKVKSFIELPKLPNEKRRAGYHTQKTKVSTHNDQRNGERDKIEEVEFTKNYIAEQYPEAKGKNFYDSIKCFYEAELEPTRQHQHKKHKDAYHKDRAKKIDSIEKYMDMYCPIEGIYTLGDKDLEQIPKDLFWEIIQEQIAWEQATFPLMHCLTASQHIEKGARHAHFNYLFLVKDKDGFNVVNQEEALKQMGIPKTKLTPEEEQEIKVKKIDAIIKDIEEGKLKLEGETPEEQQKEIDKELEARFNNGVERRANRKNTFTRMCREHFNALAFAFGISVNIIPKEPGKAGMPQLKYIAMNEREKAEEAEKRTEKAKEQLQTLNEEIEENKKDLETVTEQLKTAKTNQYKNDQLYIEYMKIDMQRMDAIQKRDEALKTINDIEAFNKFQQERKTEEERKEAERRERDKEAKQKEIEAAESKQKEKAEAEMQKTPSRKSTHAKKEKDKPKQPETPTKPTEETPITSAPPVTEPENDYNDREYNESEENSNENTNNNSPSTNHDPEFEF